MDKEILLEQLDEKLDKALADCIDEYCYSLGNAGILEHVEVLAKFKKIMNFNYDDLDTEQIRYLVSLSNPLMSIYSLWVNVDEDIDLAGVIEHITVDCREVDEEYGRSVEEAKQKAAEDFTDRYNSVVNKLYTELMEFEKNTPPNERDEDDFWTEFAMKKGFRDVLGCYIYDDDSLNAISKIDNILQVVYDFAYQNDSPSADPIYIHDVTDKFIETTRHSMFCEMVYDRMSAEYEKYIAELMSLPPEKIIAQASKLMILEDIKYSLEPHACFNMSEEQLKAILALDNPLWCFYNEWNKDSSAYLDDLKEAILNRVDFEIAENKKENNNVEKEYFNEEEQEAGHSL